MGMLRDVDAYYAKLCHLQYLHQPHYVQWLLIISPIMCHGFGLLSMVCVLHASYQPRYVMWVLVATPSMIMDACFELRYVLWMLVMSQVMCCRLVIQEKQCVVDVCYQPIVTIGFMPCGFMLLGRCLCYQFLFLVIYVSWVPTTEQIFVLQVFVISHVLVSCYWLFVGIDGSEYVSFHAT